MGDDLAFADLKSQFACYDVKHLVLTWVTVQRRRFNKSIVCTSLLANDPHAAR
ncbi:MAG TPA: hypothetical protein VM915_12510 [Verrucomicrobiae bacterium]|nr:hypothetical protein [Verrucomicrobiae bacterium]